MTDTRQTITDLTHRLDAHSSLPRDTRIPYQLLKIQEEAGEVAKAAIGLAGENPRKGVTHTQRDLEAKVCDVIVTAMVALTRLSPDAEAIFAHRTQHITDRDPDPNPPVTSAMQHPEPTAPDTSATDKHT
ncbi:MazG-like family protein [Streptomyces sp. NPDC052225]|uniref:MazG-like family protein n=1 Tax=Streptomyces sp. NPDC052225 TaxID=3154949 RepID=UPI003427BA8B